MNMKKRFPANHVSIYILLLGTLMASIAMAASRTGGPESELHRKLNPSQMLPNASPEGINPSVFERSLVEVYSHALTYQLCDLDSKDTGRVIAMERLKVFFVDRLADEILKEMNRSDTSFEIEEIKSIIPSMIKFELLKDEWQDQKLYLKAKVETAPSILASFISTLSKNRRQIDDLLKVRSMAGKASVGIEQMQADVSPPGDGVSRIDRYNRLVSQLDAVHWYEKARYLGHTGEGFQAIDAYGRAIGLYPNFPEAYYNRGWFYQFQQKDYQKALSDFDHAIAFDPEEAFYYNSRGFCRAHIEDNQGAIADYNRTLELDPANLIAVMRRAECYVKLGELKQAHTDYSRAISLGPDLPHGYYGRAIVNRKLDDYAAAIQDLDAVLKINPENADALYERGITYAYLNEKEKVLADFKAAARYGNKDARVFLRSKDIEW